jgi:hypothetical protein
MEVAKVIDGQVLEVGHYRDISDLTHPPTDEQLADRHLFKVNLWRDHDPATQKLVRCAPVFEDPWVYTVEVQNLTQEELNARAQQEQ